MADLKISQLGSIVTVVPATDVLPVVQGATTYKVTPNQLLGAGGVATLASATITGAATVGTTLGVTGVSTLASAVVTGDLTVDTSTLKVDSTNNRVGILTASPRSPFALDVLGNVALGDSTTTTGLRLKLDCLGTAGNVAVMSFATAGTNKAFYGLSGGYLGDASTDAIVATDAAGAGIRFYVSNTGAEAMRLNSTANLVLKGGTAAANGVGITFPATQVASSDANCLDDYEEGTWDASFGTGGGTVTINTAYNRCRYTKIGRLVTVNGFIQVSSVSSPTGVLIITGLPFAIPSTTEGDAYSAVSVFPDNLEVTGTGQIVGFGLPSSSGIYLYRYQAGVSIGLAPSTKAGSEFTFTLTYSV
jgi:hypothetical protein